MAPFYRVIAVTALLLLAGCTGGVDTTPTQQNPVASPSSPSPAPIVSPTATASSTASSFSPSTSTQTASPRPTSPTSRGPQQGTQWSVTITRVIDGDTVEARFPNGEIDTLRLLGVDTPETTYSRVDPGEFKGIPSTTAGRDHLFNWGEKASEFSKNELDGKAVSIAVDPAADRRGSFGRLLVYIYVHGENFNKRLISEGYARMYDSSYSKRSQFRRAEETSQANNVGLWNFESSTLTPAPSGDRGGSIIVSQVHENAQGNDHENENDEYIIFKYTGSNSLDLTGWTVSDAATTTYHFPSGFKLDAGEKVTLYTGTGSDSDTKLYWGSDSAIWNNGGDTIIVTNGEGEVFWRNPISL